MWQKTFFRWINVPAWLTLRQVDYLSGPAWNTLAFKSKSKAQKWRNSGIHCSLGEWGCHMARKVVRMLGLSMTSWLKTGKEMGTVVSLQGLEFCYQQWAWIWNFPQSLQIRTLLDFSLVIPWTENLTILFRTLEL